MTEWVSDPEAAAVADQMWENMQHGDVTVCGYHADGRCTVAGRPCAEAIQAAKDKSGPSSRWCIWSPAED
jgi:hypothetical protein